MLKQKLAIAGTAIAIAVGSVATTAGAAQARDYRDYGYRHHHYHHHYEYGPAFPFFGPFAHRYYAPPPPRRSCWVWNDWAQRWVWHCRYAPRPGPYYR